MSKAIRVHHRRWRASSSICPTPTGPPPPQSPPRPPGGVRTAAAAADPGAPGRPAGLEHTMGPMHIGHIIYIYCIFYLF